MDPDLQYRNQVDSTLALVDKFLQDSNAEVDAPPRYQRPGGYYENIPNPIDSTKQDINKLLSRAKLSPTKYEMPRSRILPSMDESSEINDSLNIDDYPNTPGSPSYEFMNKQYGAGFSSTNPSPNIYNPPQQTNSYQNSTPIQPQPEPYQVPSKPILKQPKSSTTIQSAAQIEKQMLMEQNAQLRSELEQMKAQLNELRVKNTAALAQLERNQALIRTRSKM